MPKRLKRYYGFGHLHFVTFSCYRRMALLGTARSRNVFVRALAEVSFVFPAPATRFWQPRFYDFNVWSAKKLREKLDYMHRNPMTRRLVTDPKDWVWSSYASYSGRGTPLLKINFIP